MINLKILGSIIAEEEAYFGSHDDIDGIYSVNLRIHLQRCSLVSKAGDSHIHKSDLCYTDQGVTLLQKQINRSINFL